MKAEGYPFGGGENIQANRTANPPADAMAAWKKSPIHRKNLLLPDAKEVGVGVARGKDGLWYFCQVFGTGKPPAAVAPAEGLSCAITNSSGKPVTLRIKGQPSGSTLKEGVTTKLVIGTKARSIVAEVVPTEEPRTPVEVTLRHGKKYAIKKDAKGAYTVEEVK
jgi:hypothetical protein